MDRFELTDDVVVLRAPEPADVDRITELCQDPDVQEWTVVPSPYTRADAAGFVDHVVDAGWASGAELTWAVRDAATGRLDGMVGLSLAPGASAEIGYWLGPDARGRGVMTRAVRLVVDHALRPDGLGLDRLSWSAVVGNTASLRVAERAGFRVEGTVRGFVLQRGSRRDGWVGTLLAGDPRP
ncbi:GNAT family N-acetyltransferase [Cellulomonas cellasea]|uniref:RimJ/RimL family protein N-acetyltransferase n=1 Tax=Cellulomonas cellasea TaxID=43670 RepID=A0A7W4UE26_9CELL|nr:GNAT family N-acetyltransferase [Cellulomonas cellasea]MBB2922114.1 RimJ/RimL family protein N-acetyltransferase [Cellulomonas cellasea]